MTSRTNFSPQNKRLPPLRLFSATAAQPLQDGQPISIPSTKNGARCISVRNAYLTAPNVHEIMKINPQIPMTNKPLVPALLRQYYLTRDVPLLAYQDASAFYDSVQRDPWNADRVNLSILLTSARWLEPGYFEDYSTAGDTNCGGYWSEGGDNTTEVTEEIGFGESAATEAAEAREISKEKGSDRVQVIRGQAEVEESVAERVKRRKRNRNMS